MVTSRYLIGMAVVILWGAVPRECAGRQTHVDNQDSNDAPRTFRMVEEVRIGDPDGAMEYVFGRIASVEVGKDGRFMVADPQVPVIRVYDSEGNFMHNLGRAGRGPGEYNGMNGMQAFPDGSLALSDSRNRRVNLYDPEGEPLGSHSVMNGLHSSHVFQVDHDGNFYIKGVYSESRMKDIWDFYWKKYTPEGEVSDTLDLPPEEEPQGFVLVTPPGYAYPFIERRHTYLSPLGYLVSGTNGDYRLTWNPPDGDPVTLNPGYDPVPVKPEEHDQWESFRNRFDLDLPIPGTKPAFKDFKIDIQGRIWVRRYVEAELTDAYSSGSTEQWWERPTYDIFMPDGSFFGRVVMPWNTRWEEARGNKVWAVLEGENDIPYVVRYRLEEATVER